MKIILKINENYIYNLFMLNSMSYGVLSIFKKYNQIRFQ